MSPAAERLVVAVTCTVAGLWPRSGVAQSAELRAEIGASRILPPAGVDGGAADFLVAGLRASGYGRSGSSAYGSLQVGRALDRSTGGDFLSGEIGGVAVLPLARAWSAEARGRAFAFRVDEPFGYEAGAAEGALGLRYRPGPISVQLAGAGGVGRSRVVLSTVVQRMRRQALIRQVLVDDLWHYGADLEVLAGGRPFAAGLAGGVHQTAGGTLRSMGARMVAVGRMGAVELRVDAWRTPEGTRNTGGLAFYVPWGAWSARGTAGRPDPDPLLLVEPGREAEGMLLGLRILGGASEPARTSLHQVMGETPEGIRVRFVLENPPQGAERVDLAGDFTLWKPVAMAHRGRRWSAEVVIPAGTYHFGFLLDGVWYLPAEAADAVPDEWGRRSAILVIESDAGS